MKISTLLLDFSTESAEKSIIHKFLFLVKIYSPGNYNKHPTEIRR